MPFPNVYEPRPVRQSKPLSDEEQKKLESELSNLRDSQNRRANPDLAPPPPETKKEATKPAAKPAKEAKPAKPALKKMADKPKAEEAAQKKPPKKKDDSLVPDQKPPSAFKPIE